MIVSDVGLYYHTIVLVCVWNNIISVRIHYNIIIKPPELENGRFLCAKNKLQTHRFNLLKHTALCKRCLRIYRVTCKSINSIRSRHTHYCYTVVRTRRGRFDLVLGWPTDMSEVGVHNLPV